MSSSDEDETIQWDMMDDRKFVLRAGYKFPHAMTYPQMVSQVNLEVQKVGSDPVRPNIKHKLVIGGCSVPSVVNFYCCHGRSHGEQVGKKPVKDATKRRASRSTEPRSILFSKCCLSFNVVLDPSFLHGVEEGDSDAEDGPASHATAAESSTSDGVLSQKKSSSAGTESTSLSHTDAHHWMVQAQHTGTRKGRPVVTNFKHCGHPKRTLHVGDIDDSMRDAIRLAARTNTPLSTLQAMLLETHKVFISMSQLRYEIETMADLGVVNGTITSAHARSNCNQAEAAINWILEQEDTEAVILLEDVDCSSPTKVAFETWVRKNGQDRFSRVRSELGEFDGADAVKGGHRDETRFIRMDGRRLFLVAMVWTFEHEVRTFSFYPELLVVDGKMNTNKSRLEYFLGVGIEGAWGSSVLFRAWLPNKTEQACSWLWLHAIPLLFSAALLAAILGVMSDDCSTMQPILVSLVCKAGGILPNARSYLCIYHFQRNFFSKFGMGSSVRQWNLAGSKPTSKRGGNWGGKIEWQYPWQRILCGAIYKLQQCESDKEFQACISWIADVINTAPNMGPLRGDLRNAVRKFFQLKIQMQPKWAKFYRLTVRMFDADASSRAEGEFSDIWQLGLTASMAFRTSLVKIRFGSDRRMHRKIEKAETLMGTQLKRRKFPMYESNDKDWKCLCDKFTPHYHKKVESQIRAAHSFLTGALIEKSDTTVRWKVWSKSLDDDQIDAASDDDSDDESEENNDDDVRPPRRLSSCR